jgi:hypothetical protein
MALSFDSKFGEYTHAKMEDLLQVCPREMKLSTESRLGDSARAAGITMFFTFSTPRVTLGLDISES